MDLRLGECGLAVLVIGFGGSAITLAPIGVIPQVRLAAASAFSERGYRVPGMFVVRPSQGARRDT